MMDTAGGLKKIRGLTGPAPLGLFTALLGGDAHAHRLCT